MRLSSYPYTSISSIQIEARLVRPRNAFPVINSSMSLLAGPGIGKVVLIDVSKSMSVHYLLTAKHCEDIVDEPRNSEPQRNE
ncbi:hypothetical protein TNCV_2101731 [Trichonephila clavipes]|nr:hypothetical protein TNCV_2101731 [Trichonephila clavipes]